MVIGALISTKPSTVNLFSNEWIHHERGESSRLSCSSRLPLLNMWIPSRTPGRMRNRSRSMFRATASFVCLKISLYRFNHVLGELHRRDGKHLAVKLYLRCPAMHSCGD